MRTLVGQGAGLLLQGRAGEALGVLSNAADRRVERRRSEDDDFRLAAARAIVGGKLANSRLLLRRYYRFRPVDGHLC
ncbi:MAG TPA: CRISPR-associated endonuclease Cas1, partial [Accumulibacter sp.]|nr:CRISPR-associated endonuclease Cas1 [Accumulibacter sp.]